MVKRMSQITVNASISYKIEIGKGILADCGRLVKPLKKSGKIAVITDDIVNGLYGDTVIKAFESDGFEVCRFVFKNGESSKCAATLHVIYDFLAANKITRSDMIAALGGGVVGDISGFAAATWLRGIDYVQIPTTLLAQVDSSVGGKTAIDIAAGKNLVGAFKQPRMVICDISVLDTLTPQIFADGMGEVIKYGMIRSKNIFDSVKSGHFEEKLTEIIEECITIKKEIVEADEFEKRERMLLNFGHTFGHSIEKAQNFSGITHGEAVAVGMCIITHLGIAQGICTEELYSELCECLKNNSLPITTEFDTKMLAEYSLSDKKKLGSVINLIYCTEVGKSEIVPTETDKFIKMSERG